MEIRLSPDLEERARSAWASMSVDEFLARFPEVPRDLRDEPALQEYTGLRPPPASGPETHAVHARWGRCPACVLYAAGEQSGHLRHWPRQARSDSGAAFGPARAVPEAARHLRMHPRAAEGAGDASLGLRLDRRANWLRQTSFSVVAGPRQTTAAAADQLLSLVPRLARHFARRRLPRAAVTVGEIIASCSGRIASFEFPPPHDRRGRAAADVVGRYPKDKPCEQGRRGSWAVVEASRGSVEPRGDQRP